MNLDALAGRKFDNEFVFNATRSSGPGGQNVNKVSTKIELRFDVLNSSLLTQDEKDILLTRLKSKISKEGILIIAAQAERSQFENRETAIRKFHEMINRALTPVKKRKKTTPSSSSKLKRKEEKIHQSRKKAGRKPSFED